MKKIIKALLALALVASALTGCTSKAEPKNPQDDIVFDEQKQAQLVIVGGGAAGLSSAIEAIENGAESVIILEKTGKTGGSLNFTSGSMSGAETIIQEIDGISDTKESFVQDIIKNGAGLGNEELIRVFVEEDTQAINWLWENGLKDKTFTLQAGKMSAFAPEHALYSVQRTYKAKPTDAKSYKSVTHEILDTVLAKYADKITVLLNTEATTLVPNAKGQVLTVVANDLESGKVLRVDASKGIIMATGGYSGNGKLMGEYAKNGKDYLVGGGPAADGSSLLMMQKVGANVDDKAMSYIPTFPMGLEIAPGTGVIAPTYTWKTGGICVNQEGKRFVDETEEAVEVREVALEEQTNAVQYDIFTDAVIEDLIANNAAIFWSYFYAPGKPYNAFLIEANSVEELAAKINVPADSLKATIDAYNTSVESKETDEFGRQYSEDSIGSYNLAVNKIEGEKYYAVALKALCVMTLGGVSVNKDMQVMDASGKTIPGLFAAGEVVGGVWGRFVSSGTGVMGPVAFGRIAARKALELDLVADYTVKAASKLLNETLFKKDVIVKDDYDMSGIKDGTYNAKVNGQNGEMEVQVVVVGNKIGEVTIVSHNETNGIGDPALEAIPTAIVSANKPNVDVVTNATLTSDRIMEAVKACLDASKK